MVFLEIKTLSHLEAVRIKRHLELTVTTISCSAGAISVGTGDGAALMAMASIYWDMEHYSAVERYEQRDGEVERCDEVP